MDINNYIKPLIEQRADPYIYKHSDGYYYFTASVPTYDYIELRRAKTIDALSSATTAKIWKRHESGIMSEHIWAQKVGGEKGISNLYIAEMESPVKLKTVQTCVLNWMHTTNR